MNKEKNIELKKEDNVATILKDISTDKLHYVKVPEQMIVIDFDNRNKEYYFIS